MRGLWTAGVTDVMMEHDIWPDGLIGVSAGAAFGCNIKSRQIGRAIRYNTRFAKDARYSGLRSLLSSGDYFNAEFGYHIVPKEYDIFDTETFQQNPMQFTVVCTDVLTGKAVYHDIDHVDFDELEWLRASASMPLASKVVKVQGYQLLDGGITRRRSSRLHPLGIFRATRLHPQCGHPDAAQGVCEGAQQADAYHAHCPPQISSHTQGDGGTAHHV